MEQQQAKPLQQSTRSRFFSVDTWTSVCAGGRVNADVRMDAALRGPWPSFPGHLLPHRPSRPGQHAAPRGSPGLPGRRPGFARNRAVPFLGKCAQGATTSSGVFLSAPGRGHGPLGSAALHTACRYASHWSGKVTFVPACPFSSHSEPRALCLQGTDPHRTESGGPLCQRPPQHLPSCHFGECAAVR